MIAVGMTDEELESASEWTEDDQNGLRVWIRGLLALGQDLALPPWVYPEDEKVTPSEKLEMLDALMESIDATEEYTEYWEVRNRAARESAIEGVLDTLNKHTKIFGTLSMICSCGLKCTNLEEIDHERDRHIAEMVADVFFE